MTMSNQLDSQIETEKEILRSARKLACEPLKEPRSTSELIEWYARKHTKVSDERHNTNGGGVHYAFLSEPYLPSFAPLRDLTTISVTTLTSEKHHRGQYVVLRALLPACRISFAIELIAEDEDGSLVMIDYCHQEDEAAQKAANIFPKDSICIIKEPYYAVSAEGLYHIKVDHVSDLMMIPVDDTRVPAPWRSSFTMLGVTAEGSKSKGNAAMKAGDYNVALDHYAAALKCALASEEIVPLELNLCLAHLRLGRYDAGLGDAKAALDILQLPAGHLGSMTTAQIQALWKEKCLYRQSRCLYELGKFGDSARALTALLRESPQNEDAVRQFKRAMTRVKEERLGIYPFQEMHRSADEIPPALDNATFIGPIKIQDSKGRGRGLFAVRDVEPGELLICEKAFSFVYADNESAMLSPKILINPYNDDAAIGPSAQMIAYIAQKLFRNPSQISAVTALHAGSYEPTKETEVDGNPIIDTFHINEIIKHNSFGCPPSTLSAVFPPPSTSTNPSTSNASESTIDQAGHHSTGLFLTASYMNHSCTCNARRSHIGDMLIVRATRFIPAGEEVMFWYRPPPSDMTISTAQEEKERTWGFRCDCRICAQEFETAKEVFDLRGNLLRSIAEFTDRYDIFSDEASLIEVEDILALLEMTYPQPATALPRLTVCPSCVWLMTTYTSRREFGRSINFGFALLRALGFSCTYPSMSELPGALAPSRTSQTAYNGNPRFPEPVDIKIHAWGLLTDHVLLVWIHIWHAYHHLGYTTTAAKAREYAKLVYKVIIGEDETFDEVFGRTRSNSNDLRGEMQGAGWRKLGLEILSGEEEYEIENAAGAGVDSDIVQETEHNDGATQSGDNLEAEASTTAAERKDRGVSNAPEDGKIDNDSDPTQDTLETTTNDDEKALLIVDDTLADETIDNDDKGLTVNALTVATTTAIAIEATDTHKDDHASQTVSALTGADTAASTSRDGLGGVMEGPTLTDTPAFEDFEFINDNDNDNDNNIDPTLPALANANANAIASTTRNDLVKETCENTIIEYDPPPLTTTPIEIDLATTISSSFSGQDIEQTRDKAIHRQDIVEENAEDFSAGDIVDDGYAENDATASSDEEGEGTVQTELNWDGLREKYQRAWMMNLRECEGEY